MYLIHPSHLSITPYTTICEIAGSLPWKNGKNTKFGIRSSLTLPWRLALVVLCVLLSSLFSVRSGMHTQVRPPFVPATEQHPLMGMEHSTENGPARKVSQFALLGLGQPLHSLAAGPALEYSSYVGGDGADKGKGVALDSLGNIYVIGETESDDFLGSGHSTAGYSDIFVAKFDATGAKLIYLTFIGSDGTDTPLAIGVDNQGNAYGTGLVFEDTFPAKNALWPSRPARANSVLFKLDGKGDVVYSTYLPLDVFEARQNLAIDGVGNAYVTGTYYEAPAGNVQLGSQMALLKLSPDGSQLLLDRHIGGNGVENGTALALDDSGNIYLAGTTAHGDGFPITPNAHQTQCGDILTQRASYCYEDGVVVVMNAAGQVTYASYHGGSFTDEPQAIAADGQGNVVIAGNTASGQFPLKHALQESCPLNQSTGDCNSPRGFVSAIHIQPGQSTLTYSTYLGSTERDSTNVVLAAKMDHAGNAYIAGYTNGRHFPVKNALQAQLYESFCTTFGSQRYCFDGFVAQFSSTGELTFGTYLGATYDEFAYGLAVDGSDNVYLAGTTEADDFPVTAGAFQSHNSVGDDAFLVKIGAAGNEPPPGIESKQIFLPVTVR